MAISEAVLLRNLQFRTPNPKPTTNPRNQSHQLGFQLLDRINNDGGGGGGEEEMMQKPLTPILDRFTALVKEEEKSEEEIVGIYEIVLAELCFNAKPIISELTVIAGEQRKHGQGIADAICDRIIKVPSEQKLPSLYLLDSIVKNVGFEYKKYFASRLYEVFCMAYRNVQPNQHSAMQYLFRTWKAVFPASVLQKIGDELQFFPLVNQQSSASVSCLTLASLSTQGVNVNPKFPETEHVTVEIQDAEDISASLERYGRMNHPQHDEHDIHQTDILSNLVINKRLGSPGIAACTSTGRAEMQISSKINSAGSSPLRVESYEALSPSSDGFLNESSPKRAIQNASEFQYGLPYGPGRVNKRDVDRSGLWTKCSSVSSNLYTEAIKLPHLSNGCDQLGPRALIKAYGRDTRDTNLNEKPLRMEWPDANGINSEAARGWQNTEEEEFVWKEMSPTLGHHSRSDDLIPSKRSVNISTRNGWGNMAPEPKINFSGPPQLPLDDSANLGCGSGDMGENFGFGLGTRSEETEIQGSYGSTHPRHSQHKHSQHNVPQFVQQRNLKASGKVPLSMAPTLAEKHLGKMPFSSFVTPQICPLLDLDESHTLPPFPMFPQQKQQRDQVDLLDARKPLTNQGLGDSSVLGFNSIKLVSNQLRGPTTSLNNQSQAQVSYQEVQEYFKPQVPVPSHLSAQQSFSFGNSIQGHGPAINSFQLPGLSSALIHSVPNASFQLQAGQLPQLPLGATLPSSMMSPSQNIGPLACQPPFQNNADSSAPHLPAGGALSGLINSLVSQGLISLAPSVSVQDSVGVEFNADLLKVRNESVITALYADLPRQCTTCGLRFKCREEHSAHMDWHVTRNRASKNRKPKPSRNWFASTSVWLSSAEALGTDPLPGFVPTETVVEKNDYEEIGVPADENQNACALCGECFDDFYSDEKEEWMYRGAVYMDEPNGSAGGGDRSLLGPIVHAKCLSGSVVISSEDCGLDQAARVEEDSQRKRRRL